MKRRLLELHKAHDGKCAYCPCITVLREAWFKKYNDGDTATIDHVIPRARGGRDHWQNLALACRACNTLKGALTLDEFNKVRKNEPTGSNEKSAGIYG